MSRVRFAELEQRLADQARELEDLPTIAELHHVPTPIAVEIRRSGGLRRLDVAALTRAAARVGMLPFAALVLGGVGRGDVAGVLDGTINLGPIRRQQLAHVVGVAVADLWRCP